MLIIQDMSVRTEPRMVVCVINDKLYLLSKPWPIEWSVGCQWWAVRPLQGTKVSTKTLSILEDIADRCDQC